MAEQIPAPVRGEEKMPKLPSPRHQPNILREPDKKAADFRATNQSQSNAGTYDDRGGNRSKKVLAWVIAILVVALVITFVVDAIAGREVV